MPRHILAAVTPGPHAHRILQRARHLALQHAADLTVISVLHGSLGLAMDGAAKEAAMRATREALAETLADAGDPPLRIEFGNPAAIITACAEDLGADLIVLGPNEQKSLSARIIGSTTDRVLRQATVPVLIVRRPPDGDYCGVLVGLDDSPAAQAGLRTAAALCPGHPLQLVAVTDLPMDFEQALLLSGTPKAEITRWRNDLRRQTAAGLQERAADWPNTRPRVFVGLPEVVLVRLSRAPGVDLIVLGSRGRGPIMANILGSVALRVAREARADVLVVPAGTD
ncbi:universal stress protein [Halodurantibacterium flavum]|uniref:Universal stress protein n=1 Tax=Halodurantibacterium flavum TaxID=1382802 RepID=A0ABW4S6W0_9RHOB